MHTFYIKRFAINVPGEIILTGYLSIYFTHMRAYSTEIDKRCKITRTGYLKSQRVCILTQLFLICLTYSSRQFALTSFIALS